MKQLIFFFLLSTIIYANDSKALEYDKTQENKVEIQEKAVVNNENTFNDFASDFDNEFTKTETKEPFDPLSGYNRIMTSFNDGVYTYALSPVATGYSKVMPETIRIAFSNFIDNLLFPVRFVNNLLQFKFENSAEELGRFVVNTIWGLGGFMDPAKEELGWVAHKEDFGQTLGFWGVGEGFHVVLPFLGPSNLRDMVGLTADAYVSPINTTAEDKIAYKLTETGVQQLGLTVFDTVNTTSLRLGQYENLKKDALDLYPFLRDIYTQNRNKLIEE